MEEMVRPLPSEREKEELERFFNRLPVQAYLSDVKSSYFIAGFIVATLFWLAMRALKVF